MKTSLYDYCVKNGKEELLSEWNQSKNAPLSPATVLSGTHRKVWWVCAKGHEWEAGIAFRVRGDGCPVCAGKRAQAGETDLLSQHPEIAVQWHPTKNGTKKADEVTAFSNLRVWWLCEKGHEFQGAISDRVRRAQNCPYCMNRKVWVGFNDLATTHPWLAAEWHPELNETLMPQNVVAGSHKKIWWRCSAGHVWRTAVYARAGTQQHGCPVCAGRVRSRIPKALPFIE